eukprot:comp15019_c0_seq1/m.11639 comp15019_c0_seq1/g.11639  ORF comp15019_c0_seq1/g.11639 comp15019_c0_seq1/m.11639 type:complete len:120 (-) comp15019_c0_seq1:135-494(-)
MTDPSASLSLEQQVVTVIVWYHEWSREQRGDFFRRLMNETCYLPDPLSALLSTLEIHNEDEPGTDPTTFNQQMKYFLRWLLNWSQPQRQWFMHSLHTIDPDLSTPYLATMAQLGHNWLP